MNKNNINLEWHEVEEQIRKEINWLKQSIDTFGIRNDYDPITCSDCLLRKISELIVSGEILAKEITRSKELESFWADDKKITVKGGHHGSDWHREMMERIEIHFLSQGFQVEREPNLNWGRADLGVYKNDHNNLYIEVGTTSLCKLYINLLKMNNFVILIVPDDNRLIEFTKN